MFRGRWLNPQHVLHYRTSHCFREAVTKAEREPTAATAHHIMTTETPHNTNLLQDAAQFLPVICKVLDFLLI